MTGEEPGNEAGKAGQGNSVLLEVVRGLRHEPVLLFGIGAGVILIAVLGATSNIVALVVVAAVLVVALAGWIGWKAMGVRSERRRIGVRVDAERADVKRSALGNVDAARDADVRTRISARDAKVTDSKIGNVRVRERTRRRDG